MYLDELEKMTDEELDAAIAQTGSIVAAGRTAARTRAADRLSASAPQLGEQDMSNEQLDANDKRRTSGEQPAWWRGADDAETFDNINRHISSGGAFSQAEFDEMTGREFNAYRKAVKRDAYAAQGFNAEKEIKNEQEEQDRLTTLRHNQQSLMREQVKYILDNTKEGDKADAELRDRANQYLKALDSGVDFTQFDDARIGRSMEEIAGMQKTVADRRGSDEVFVDSLERGYSQTAVMAAMAYLGMTAGDDPENVKDMRNLLSVGKELDAANPKKIGSVSEIKGAGDVLDFVLESIGENLYRGAVGIAGGVAGGAIAGAAGAMVGAGLSTLAMNTGEAVQDQIEEGVPFSRGWALAQGLGYSALDGAFGFEAGLGKLAVKTGLKRAAKDGVRKWAKDVGTMATKRGALKTFAKGVAGEALQESAQSQIIGRARRWAQTGSPLRKGETVGEAWMEALDEAAGGAAAALGMGGAGSVISHANSKRIVRIHNRVVNAVKQDAAFNELPPEEQLLVAKKLMNDSLLETSGVLSDEDKAVLRRQNKDIEADLGREDADAATRAANKVLRGFDLTFAKADFDETVEAAKGEGFQSRIDWKKMRDSAADIGEVPGGYRGVRYTDPATGLAVVRRFDKNGKTVDFIVENVRGLKDSLTGDALHTKSLGKALEACGDLDVFNQYRAAKSASKRQIIADLFSRLYGDRGVNLVIADSLAAIQDPNIRSQFAAKEEARAAYKADDNTVYVLADQIQNIGQLYTDLAHERAHADIAEFILGKSGGAETKADRQQLEAGREKRFATKNARKAYRDAVRRALEEANKQKDEALREASEALDQKADAAAKAISEEELAEWGEENTVERTSVNEVLKAVRDSNYSLPGSVAAWVKRKIAGDTGFALDAISDDDVREELKFLADKGYLGKVAEVKGGVENQTDADVLAEAQTRSNTAAAAMADKEAKRKKAERGAERVAMAEKIHGREARKKQGREVARILAEDGKTESVPPIDAAKEERPDRGADMEAALNEAGEEIGREHENAAAERAANEAAESDLFKEWNRQYDNGETDLDYDEWKKQPKQPKKEKPKSETGTDEASAQPEQGGMAGREAQGEATSPVDGGEASGETAGAVKTAQGVVTTPQGAPKNESGFQRVMGRRAEIRRVPVDSLKLPDTQFKKGADPKTGVVQPLGGEYHENAENPIAVYERLDGTTEVVTGRHRLDLAKRSGRKDIAARVFREADGLTPADMKLYDAVSNILDEKGTVEDYARFFAESGFSDADAKESGVLAQPKGRMAYGIVKNATDATRSAIDWDGSGETGKITPEQAAVVAEAAPKGSAAWADALQAQLVAEAAKGRRGTAFRLFAMQMAQMAERTGGGIKAQSGEMAQGDLFGGSAFEDWKRAAEKTSEYRAQKAAEYGKVAEVLRIAVSRKAKGKLNLDKAYAKELGIRDASSREQLVAARDKALERKRYWESAPALEQADMDAMLSALGIAPETIKGGAETKQATQNRTEATVEGAESQGATQAANDTPAVQNASEAKKSAVAAKPTEKEKVAARKAEANATKPTEKQRAEEKERGGKTAREQLDAAYDEWAGEKPPSWADNLDEAHIEEYARLVKAASKAWDEKKDSNFAAKAALDRFEETQGRSFRPAAAQAAVKPQAKPTEKERVAAKKAEKPTEAAKTADATWVDPDGKTHTLTGYDSPTKDNVVKGRHVLIWADNRTGYKGELASVGPKNVKILNNAYMGGRFGYQTLTFPRKDIIGVLRDAQESPAATEATPLDPQITALAGGKFRYRGQTYTSREAAEKALANERTTFRNGDEAALAQDGERLRGAVRLMPDGKLSLRVREKVARSAAHPDGWAVRDVPVKDKANLTKLIDNGGMRFKSAPAKDADGIRFKSITDNKLLDKLNSGETVKVYRAMQVIDGKLYPPMSARINKNMQQGIDYDPSTGTIVTPAWYQADEHPEALLRDKQGNIIMKPPRNKDEFEHGVFRLDKAQKGQTNVDASYNPYWHTSRTPLNDQFSSASERPELVTVECEIPASELTSSYHADYAKDTVGEKNWHSGPVSSWLSEYGKSRKVILSRFVKVNRVVPDAEVATTVRQMLAETDISIPQSVITPSLRAELERLGIDISRQNRAAYSWDKLVKAGKKPRTMEIPQFKAGVFAPSASQKEMVNAARESVRRIGGRDTERGLVMNIPAFGDVVVVGKSGLSHGLRPYGANYGRIDNIDNANILPVVGEILNNSIPVNELRSRDTSKNDGATILLGAAQDENGDIVPVISIVEHIRDKHAEPPVAVYPLKSINVKGAHRSSLTTTSTPPSTQISIADYISAVKDALPIFSKDVYDHFKQQRQDGEFTDSLRFKSAPLKPNERMADDPSVSFAARESLAAHGHRVYSAEELGVNITDKDTVAAAHVLARDAVKMREIEAFALTSDRPVSAAEVIALDILRRDLDAELERINNAMAESPNPAAFGAEKELVETRLDKALDALQHAGSRSGQTLRAFRVGVPDDVRDSEIYILRSLKAERRRQGAPDDDAADRATAKTDHEEMQKLKDRVDELEKQLAERQQTSVTERKAKDMVRKARSATDGKVLSAERKAKAEAKYGAFSSKGIAGIAALESIFGKAASFKGGDGGAVLTPEMASGFAALVEDKGFAAAEKIIAESFPKAAPAWAEFKRRNEKKSAAELADLALPVTQQRLVTTKDLGEARKECERKLDENAGDPYQQRVAIGHYLRRYMEALINENPDVPMKELQEKMAKEATSLTGTEHDSVAMLAVMAGEGGYDLETRAEIRRKIAKMQHALDLFRQGKVNEAARESGILYEDEATALKQMEDTLMQLMREKEAEIDYLSTFSEKNKEAVERVKQLQADIKEANGVLGSMRKDISLAERKAKFAEVLEKRLAEAERTLAALRGETDSDAFKERKARVEARIAELKAAIAVAKRDENTLKRIKDKIAEYEKRIADGDYDRELQNYRANDADLQAKLALARERRNEMRRKLEAARRQRRYREMGIVGKTLYGVGQILGEMKGIVASFDLSSVLRQGGQLSWAHPFIAAKNLKETLKAVADEKYADNLMAQLRMRPNWKYYEKAGVDFTDWGENATNKEDVFLLNQYRRITNTKLLKAGVQMSERGFAMFLNLMRADVFDAMANGSTFGSAANMNDSQLKALGRFINIASQRGSFEKGGKTANAIPFLNYVLWSPRNVASRFQFLYETAKLAGGGAAYGDKTLRSLFAKELVRYIGGMSAAAMFMKAVAELFRDDDEPPTETEFDPRSSDFLKVRFGNVRMDLTSGLTPIIVLGARFISGESKNLRGQTRKFNPLEGLGKFARQKFAPAASLVWDLAGGETFDKQDVDWGSLWEKDAEHVSAYRHILSSFVPLSGSDLLEQAEIGGLPKTFVTGAMSLLGANVQAFDPYNYKQLKGDYSYFKGLYDKSQDPEERRQLLEYHPMLKRRSRIESALKRVRDLENLRKRAEKNGYERPDLGERIKTAKEVATGVMTGID